MTRRTILLALLAALPLRAAGDPAQQVWDVLTGMASSLAAGDPSGFLRPFDPAMKGYEDLRVAVTGLLAEYQLESSIDPVDNGGDDRSRTLQVQWSLRLVSRSDLQRVVDRQVPVTLRFERQRGKWKIVEFAAAGLFAAPSVRMELAHQRGLGVLLLHRGPEVREAVRRDIFHANRHRA